MGLTDDLRSFNRFYTREIGLLNRRLPGGNVSLAEARVLYEIGHARPPGETAAEIGRTLGMDKGRLSRIVARFGDRGWVLSRASPEHARRLRLSLTRSGAAALDKLENGARAQIDGIARSGRRERQGAAGASDRRPARRARSPRGANCARTLRLAAAAARARRRRVDRASAGAESITRNTAGTGPTRGSPVRSSAASSWDSIPPARTHGSPSAAGRSSARSS